MLDCAFGLVAFGIESSAVRNRDEVSILEYGEDSGRRERERERESKIRMGDANQRKQGNSKELSRKGEEQPWFVTGGVPSAAARRRTVPP
jgi:hypothetical protein